MQNRGNTSFVLPPFLHGDDPQVVFLVDPQQEGLIVTVPDAAGLRPCAHRWACGRWAGPRRWGQRALCTRHRTPRHLPRGPRSRCRGGPGCPRRSGRQQVAGARAGKGQSVWLQLRARRRPTACSPVVCEPFPLIFQCLLDYHFFFFLKLYLYRLLW